MKRREILKSAVAAGFLGSTGMAAAADPKQGYLNLHWFRSRNDLDTQRLREFLSNVVVPALNRVGVKPVGLFQPSIGPDTPAVLLVAQYPSLAALEQTYTRLEGDKKWADDLAAFDAKPELAYERRENWLLRGFSSFPAIEVPKVDAGKTNLFELRMYESRNTSGHTKKVSMFNNGEIDLFRKVGINPVFFGSMMFGPKMPNLVYMTCFPSWQARDEAWAKFRVDPEWKRMSTAPGMENRELVSATSVQLMTPLPASQIL